MEKPAEMFARGHEWAALSRFLSDDQPGATLGVVYGRLRQGKTFLLDAVCRAAGGFYFGATEATNAESLRRETRLLCFSAAGFNDRLREAARASSDVVLLDAAGLYR